MEIRFSTKKRDVFLAYIVKKWNELTQKGIGRTQLQKLCYFAMAKGVPLSCEFSLHHYGPFCQRIYDTTDSLILDGILFDEQRDTSRSQYVPGENMETFLRIKNEVLEEYQSDLDEIVKLLEGLSPRHMELISTVHYSYRALKDYYETEPIKEEVVSSAFKLKGGKFGQKSMEQVYDILKDCGLLKWGNGLA